MRVRKREEHLLIRGPSKGHQMVIRGQSHLREEEHLLISEDRLPQDLERDGHLAGEIEQEALRGHQSGT